MKLNLFRKFIIANLILLTNAWAPVVATPVVDQSYLGQVTLGQGLSGTRVLAQTFTTGISGKLDAIDVLISRESFNTSTDLVVDILATSSGVPINTSLGSVTINALDVPVISLPGGFIPTINDFFNIDLTSLSLSVSSGDVLAIALSANASGYGWAGSNFDGYAGGTRSFSNNSGTSFGNQTNTDFYFQTYVSSVPEPNTLILISLALIPLLIRVKQ